MKNTVIEPNVLNAEFVKQMFADCETVIKQGDIYGREGEFILFQVKFTYKQVKNGITSTHTIWKVPFYSVMSVTNVANCVVKENNETMPTMTTPALKVWKEEMEKLKTKFEKYIETEEI